MKPSLSVHQPAGGVVLHGVQQLVGRVQAGGEQLEAAEEDCDQVRSVLGHSLQARPG